MTAVAARHTGCRVAGPLAGCMAQPEAAGRIRIVDTLVVDTLVAGWGDTVDLSAGWADSDPCCVAFPECGIRHVRTARGQHRTFAPPAPQVLFHDSVARPLRP